MACIGAVLAETGASTVYWLGPLVHCMVSPWVGCWLARRCANPRRIERRQLPAEHVLGGMWTPLIGFNVLPAVVILAVLAMQDMLAGGGRAVAAGLAWHALGIGLGLLVFGLVWQPVTSQTVLLACLPAILLQPLAISHLANRVIRGLEAQRETLWELASQDALSGLSNRHHWEAQVRREYARARRHGTPAVLVMIDLDHFKRINDLHGHAAGDAVIRGFGTLLSACLRESDVPGRYGGEEFGVLLAGSSGSAARRVIERVRGELAKVELFPDVHVTASYGIAELDESMRSPEAWMAEADRRLYAAKRAGRDYIQAGPVALPAALARTGREDIRIEPVATAEEGAAPWAPPAADATSTGLGAER